MACPTQVDVLYSAYAKTESENGIKKEPTGSLSPEITELPATLTGSTISISKLLNYVNQYFPDVFPESVLKHYGHDARPEEKLGASALLSLRDELGAQIEAVADEIKTRKAAGENTTAWEEWMENCFGAVLSQRYTRRYAAWCADEITDYPMHQFGGGTNMVRSNTVAGRVCDQNYCYVDFPAIIRTAGRNGYTADTPTKRRRRHPQRPPRRLKRWRRKLSPGRGTVQSASSGLRRPAMWPYRVP